MTDAKPPGWRTRGYLPHFDTVSGVQHIVFRLADALPAAVLGALEGSSAADRFDAAEEVLGHGLGSRALAAPPIAALVERTLLHFDGDRYRLWAWCVMPTHVHALVAQSAGCPLSRIVHGWKSFAANRANQVLGQTGRFWAPEYVDRVMRGEHDAEAARIYIEDNPVVAGLCARPGAWPWSSASAR